MKIYKRARKYKWVQISYTGQFDKKSILYKLKSPDTDKIKSKPNRTVVPFEKPKIFRRMINILH